MNLKQLAGASNKLRIRRQTISSGTRVLREILSLGWRERGRLLAWGGSGGGVQGGQRRWLDARRGGGGGRGRRVLRQRVPAQVQRRLEAAAASGASYRSRLVDQTNVLPKIRCVRVATAALVAAYARTARACAARCTQDETGLVTGHRS